MYVSIETSSDCPICFVTLGSRNKCITECGHEFCLKCMLSWSQRNVSCPCCREELIEVSTDEDDEESEDDEDQDDEDEDGEEDGEEDIEDEEESPNTGASVENIAKMFEKKGYTIADAVKLILGRHSDEENKNTDEYYFEMLGCFDDIVDTLDDEADHECSEREQMGGEDKPPVVSEVTVVSEVLIVSECETCVSSDV